MLTNYLQFPPPAANVAQAPVATRGVHGPESHQCCLMDQSASWTISLLCVAGVFKLSRLPSRCLRPNLSSSCFRPRFSLYNRITKLATSSAPIETPIQAPIATDRFGGFVFGEELDCEDMDGVTLVETEDSGACFKPVNAA